MEGPLFIVGAPRSGTSLFYRVLALHPHAAYVNNYQRRVPWLAELAFLDRLVARAPELRRRVWFGGDGDNAYRYGAARSLLERAFPQPVEGEPVFARRDVVGDGVAQPGSRAGVNARQRKLADDLARVTRAAGARVLVSKRIGHNRRIPLLAEIFPNSRFLVVARDGRAVVKSLVSVDWWPETELWWWGGTTRKWVDEGGDPWVAAARHWVEEVAAVEQGLSALPPARVLRVTYEATVRSPIDVLHGAAAFAGLGDDPRWHRDLANLRFPDRNLQPTIAISPEVAWIQAGTLRTLGYHA